VPSSAVKADSTTEPSNEVAVTRRPGAGAPSASTSAPLAIGA
jgi:hypothetical protein